jgi:2,4-diaminopentanoate dehydrogenase
LTYRVVHWGAGNTGAPALRGVINHPDLELVGLLVHSPDKVGKDAGELCGLGPVGIKAIDDPDGLFAMDADCLVYMGDYTMRPAEAIADACRFLEAGQNVVSTSFLDLVYPPSAPAHVREPIERACAAGNTTFFCNGADPGYATDLMPLTLLSLMDDIDEIRTQEISNYKHYDQPELLRTVVGYGQPLDYDSPFFASGKLTEWFGGMIHLMADQLGVKVEEIRQVGEFAPATRTVEASIGRIEEGTVGAMRFELQGIVNGKPRIVIEHSSRIDDDAAPEWPRGSRADRCYKVIMEGRPRIECELDMLDEPGNRGLLIACGMRVVNAIPYVCGAAPGLLTTLDLPMIFGRNVNF